MIVKVNGKIYDSNEEPILLILDEDDKKKIGVLSDAHISFTNNKNYEAIPKDSLEV